MLRLFFIKIYCLCITSEKNSIVMKFIFFLFVCLRSEIIKGLSSQCWMLLQKYCQIDSYSDIYAKSRLSSIWIIQTNLLLVRSQRKKNFFLRNVSLILNYYSVLLKWSIKSISYFLLFCFFTFIYSRECYLTYFGYEIVKFYNFLLRYFYPFLSVFVILRYL